MDLRFVIGTRFKLIPYTSFGKPKCWRGFEVSWLGLYFQIVFRKGLYQ